MTTKNDALKLALEALEAVTKEMLAIRDEIAERGGRPKTNAFHQRLWDSSFAAYTDKAIPAAEAIREALAEQPAQPIRWDSAAVDMTGAMATLPKTWSESVVDYKPVISDVGADANIAGIPGTYYGIVPKGTGKITVTSPPASKPLTDEQIIDIRRKTTAKQHGEWADTKAFARAIEAKLREKNA